MSVLPRGGNTKLSEFGPCFPRFSAMCELSDGTSSVDDSDVKVLISSLPYTLC